MGNTEPTTIVRTGVYIFDVQAGVTRGCGRLAFFFGVSTQECAAGIPVDTFFSAIHPDDRERVQAAVRRTMNDGGDFVERYRTIPGACETKPVRAMGFCFRDERGRASSFVGTVEPEDEAPPENVDRTIEHALAAYRLAGRAHKPFAQFLIGRALIEMGFVLPPPDA